MLLDQFCNPVTKLLSNEILSVVTLVLDCGVNRYFRRESLGESRLSISPLSFFRRDLLIYLSIVFFWGPFYTLLVGPLGHLSLELFRKSNFMPPDR